MVKWKDVVNRLIPGLTVSVCNVFVYLLSVWLGISLEGYVKLLIIIQYKDIIKLRLCNLAKF